MKHPFNLNCKFFPSVNLVTCPVLSMGLPDDIFMVEPGEKLDLSGDLLVKLFALWIEWNSFDGIKSSV